jgi:hypothetical protein
MVLLEGEKSFFFNPDANTAVDGGVGLNFFLVVGDGVD